MSGAVRLRPLRTADLPVLARLDEPDVSSFNWSGFVAGHAAGARLARDGFLGDTDGHLLVETLDGEAAGSVGWRAVEWGTPPYSRAWSIGITLLPEWRGRGFGGRAQRQLADYLFDTTAANRLEANTDVTNLPEQGALRSAGFTREGVLRGAQFRAGSWHDLVMYSQVRSDRAAG